MAKIDHGHPVIGINLDGLLEGLNLLFLKVRVGQLIVFEAVGHTQKVISRGAFGLQLKGSLIALDSQIVFLLLKMGDALLQILLRIVRRNPRRLLGSHR